MSIIEIRKGHKLSLQAPPWLGFLSDHWSSTRFLLLRSRSGCSWEIPRSSLRIRSEISSCCDAARSAVGKIILYPLLVMVDKCLYKTVSIISLERILRLDCSDLFIFFMAVTRSQINNSFQVQILSTDPVKLCTFTIKSRVDAITLLFDDQRIRLEVNDISKAKGKRYYTTLTCRANAQLTKALGKRGKWISLSYFSYRLAIHVMTGCQCAYSVLHSVWVMKRRIIYTVSPIHESLFFTGSNLDWCDALIHSDQANIVIRHLQKISEDVDGFEVLFWLSVSHQYN